MHQADAPYILFPELPVEPNPPFETFSIPEGTLIVQKNNLTLVSEGRVAASAAQTSADPFTNRASQSAFLKEGSIIENLNPRPPRPLPAALNPFQTLNLIQNIAISLRHRTSNTPLGLRTPIRQAIVERLTPIIIEELKLPPTRILFSDQTVALNEQRARALNPGDCGSSIPAGAAGFILASHKISSTLGNGHEAEKIERQFAGLPITLTDEDLCRPPLQINYLYSGALTNLNSYLGNPYQLSIESNPVSQLRDTGGY